MNYITSDLSISLFDAAPGALPFRNYEEIAAAVERDKIQLVALTASATEKSIRPSLTEAQESLTAMKFNKASKKGKPLSSANFSLKSFN